MYLNEFESKRILRRYDIPVTKEHVCINKRQSVVVASRLFDYPIVMKVLSNNIIHKKRSGGVVLNIKSSDEVFKAYNSIHNSTDETNVLIQEQLDIKKEYFIGYKIDKIFGKIILFGVGGSNVENESNIAIRSIPMKRNEICSMIERYMSDVNIKSVFFDVINKLQKMIDENPQIIEFDINPIALTYDDKLTVVDCVIKKIQNHQ